MSQSPVPILELRIALESLQSSVQRLSRVLDEAEAKSVESIFLHWQGFSTKHVPGVRNTSIDAEKALGDAIEAARQGRLTKAEQEIRKAERQGDRKPRRKGSKS